MAYVYFFRSTGEFQYVSETQQDCPWNDEYVVPDATVFQIYNLVDGVPTYVGDVDTSLAPLSEAEFKLAGLRDARDARIAETDWWVLPDRTPTQAQLDYRQALRDITLSYTSVEDVVWPEKPEV